jgi:hypothetical protein
MPPGVEENQVPRVRPDNRTVPFYPGDVRRGRVMRHYQFSARLVLGTEEDASQRVRVDMTFKSHLRPPLDVEDNAIADVACGHDVLRARFTRQLEKLAAIGLVEPGKAKPHLIGVDAATGDMRHVRRLSGQDRRPREFPEIRIRGHRADIPLPARRKATAHVKSGPKELWPHNRINIPCQVATANNRMTVRGF